MIVVRRMIMLLMVVGSACTPTRSSPDAEPKVQPKAPTHDFICATRAGGFDEPIQLSWVSLRREGETPLDVVDPVLDAAVLEAGELLITTHRNAVRLHRIGDGALTRLGKLDVPDVGTHLAAVGDLSNDGNLDILAAGRGRMSWLTVNGTQLGHRVVDVDLVSDECSAAAELSVASSGDVDRDGQPDVLLHSTCDLLERNLGVPARPSPASLTDSALGSVEEIRWCRLEKGVECGPVLASVSGGTLTCVVEAGPLGDINADGFDDVWIRDCVPGMRTGFFGDMPTTRQRLQLWLGGPDGPSSEDVQPIRWQGLFSQDYVEAFAVGDVNADGFDDVLLAGARGYTVAHGSPNGLEDTEPTDRWDSLSSRLWHSEDRQPVSVLSAPGDIDGGGVLDMLALRGLDLVMLPSGRTLAKNTACDRILSVPRRNNSSGERG